MAGARCGARRGLQWGTAAALVSARTGAPDALNTWRFSLRGYDSSRGGDVLTAGSSDVRGAGSVGCVAGPACAYPGMTRGGADSRGPRRACLPREGVLPRGRGLGQRSRPGSAGRRPERQGGCGTRGRMRRHDEAGARLQLFRLCNFERRFLPKFEQKCTR
jgi:hypothetical protein